MTPFSDPWILDGLGILLMALGAAGAGALFIATPPRPAMKRSVGPLCVVMVIGGALLMVRAEALRDADRDLDPAQFANLAKAVSRFPDVRFEVLTTPSDKETEALSSKVVAAITAGSGAAPSTGIAPPPSTVPPAPEKGLVLVTRDKDNDLGRAVAGTIARAVMAARVAVITDDDPDLDARTVRVVVRPKP